MSLNQTLIIYKFPILFEILDEIKRNLNRSRSKCAYLVSDNPWRIDNGNYTYAQTKPGDVNHFTRTRCYKHVMKEYPEAGHTKAAWMKTLGTLFYLISMLIPFKTSSNFLKHCDPSPL